MKDESKIVEEKKSKKIKRYLKKIMLLIVKATEKRPKMIKFTVRSILCTISYCALKFLKILDEDDISVIINCIIKLISFIINIFINNINSIVGLFIVLVVVFGICFCKKSDNSREIIEKLFELSKNVINNGKNETITLYDGNKKIQLTIEKEKSTSDINESKNDNIIPFKRNNTLESKQNE